MENSKPLATESFSYSWLTNRKPISSYDNNLQNNLKEHNFNFDVPVITSHDNNSLVHADEIFSDGQIMPVYIERSKIVKTLNTSTSSNSAPSSPISQLVQRSNQYYSLGRWRKSSKRILEKCIGFVKPLCRRGKCNSKVDDLDRKVFELQRWSYSVEVSPRPSLSAYNNSAVDVKSWRSSPNISPSRISNACCDAENSINEAILYCKRSNNIGS